MQSKSPSGTELDAQGVHLLVSLFFVSITLAEFALILLLSDHLQKDMISKQCLKDAFVKVQPVGIISTMCQYNSNWTDDKPQANEKDSESSKTAMLIKSIDQSTCILFLTAYLIFNCTYWTYYVSKSRFQSKPGLLMKQSRSKHLNIFILKQVIQLPNYTKFQYLK